MISRDFLESFFSFTPKPEETVCIFTHSWDTYLGHDLLRVNNANDVHAEFERALNAPVFP